MVLLNSLNQLKAKNLAEGKYADGQGLWLVKPERARGKWVLRLVVDGKRREMGLGRWPDVSIAEARDLAAEARKKLRAGSDPIEVRAKAKKKKPARLTVKQAVDGCFEAKKAELKGEGEAGRWMSPLAVHVLPVIGKTAIEDMDLRIRSCRSGRRDGRAYLEPGNRSTSRFWTTHPFCGLRPHSRTE